MKTKRSEFEAVAQALDEHAKTLPEATGGYRRVDGFERFDGKPFTPNSSNVDVPATQPVEPKIESPSDEEILEAYARQYGTEHLAWVDEWLKAKKPAPDPDAVEGLPRGLWKNGGWWEAIRAEIRKEIATAQAGVQVLRVPPRWLQVCLRPWLRFGAAKKA